MSIINSFRRLNGILAWVAASLLFGQDDYQLTNPEKCWNGFFSMSLAKGGDLLSDNGTVLPGGQNPIPLIDYLVAP